jgi:2-methylcitrate dehydratase PrpD
MTSATPSDDPMADLCRLVLATSFDDLPEEVVDCAKRSIVDTLAVTIAGSGMEGIAAVVELVKEKGGTPQTPIPLYGGFAPASEAAMAIGPMARATDLGLLHDEAGHCAEYILPAMLAALGLRREVDGREFLAAFVLGQEVLIRIGIAFRAVSSGLFARRGYGHTIFGCVAAVGKLLGLSYDQLAHAQGIARAMTQPHDLAMYSDASLIVRVHHGFIAQDAINACLLARKGITGPRSEVLAGPRGYLGFAHWETDPDAITRDLGHSWRMLEVFIKMYATCSWCQTAITGIVDQMTTNGLTATDILAVEIDECPMSYRVIAEPNQVKWNPQTVPECQFSLPYVTATAAFDGTVFLDAYSPAAMARAEVRELMSRIRINENDAVPPFGAVVRISLKDGRTFANEYLVPKGHYRNPFTREELIAKFERCAVHSVMPLTRQVVAGLIGALMSLESSADVARSVLRPLLPGPTAMQFDGAAARGRHEGEVP